MSITDELREWTRAHTVNCSDNRIALVAIADRIDAELAERYVALPLDADGVPISVGDVMEWCDPDGEVTVTCEVDAVGVECFFAWDGANGRYAQKCANAYRHHHPPTVEDVLDEFFGKANLPDGTQTRAEIIAEYAKRLRLVEEDA